MLALELLRISVSQWSEPPTGRDVPLGVLSPSVAFEACLRGELMSIRSAPGAAATPLTGDDRKNNGEDDAMFCRDARGVPCDGVCGDDVGSPCCCWAASGAIAANGLLGSCWEFREDRAGVTDSELRCDRRALGEDISSSPLR